MSLQTDLKTNIQKALNEFEKEHLWSAAINLFTTLGYDTSWQSPLDNKDFKEFKENYIDGSERAKTFSETRAFVKDWKSIDILFQLTDNSFSNENTLFNSQVNPYEIKSYLSFSIELSKHEYSKTHLASITREINKIFPVPIIIVFKYGKNITLAIINRRINKSDKDKDVLEKVTLIKDITFANPHRAHVDILFDMSLEQLRQTHEIVNFDTLHKAWTEILDTQLLNKRFYNDLFGWYLWATDEKTNVYFPNLVENANDDRDKLDEKIIRLITRLMFVWFIKQKELVPEILFSEKDLKNILKDFDAYSKTSGQYYNAILQNLFFATLNRAIEDEKGAKRGFAERKGNTDIKTLYRYDELFNISKNKIVELFSTVPFLNGGLFECLDKTKTINGVEQAYSFDGFSRNDTKNSKGHFKHRAFVPNMLFFDKEKGLFSILNKYKFTVEENTPNEEQIALDPELLGKVFENLLGVYNPETHETARNQSGSFYTPREIVNYMVDESLKAYLTNEYKNENKSKLDENIKFIKTIFSNNFLYDEKDKSKYADIAQKLKNVKVFDPSCGSGAFPMGLLNRIVDILQKISPTENIYDLKLHLIENSIYGCDIQCIATQITKLRFFISLVCDCKKDANKPNFGIPTLPNLETKFVSANSLIGISFATEKEALWGGTSSSKLIKLKKELMQIRKEHFYSNTAYKKITLRERDENKRKELIEEIKNLIVSKNETAIETARNEIERIKKEINKLPVVMVDIKAENELFDTAPKTLFQKDKNEETRNKYIKQLAIEEKKLADELSDKASDEFAKEALQKLASWNPYDQNAVSDFFDTEWMFGITDGFDIVIGNPPYVQLQNNGGALAKLYENANFKTFARTGDIYCLFYEKGCELLKQSGHLCFITSNKWMRAGYGEKTREFLANNTNPKLLIDFAGVKIFESATVDTNILLFAKEKNAQKTLCAVTNKQNAGGVKNLSLFVEQAGSQCSFTNSESWVILSPIEQSIKRKIESVGTPLKDWDINIYRGVLTGYNEAFIIDTAKRDEILSNCKTADEKKRTEELIRPILRGRDIKRYGYDWKNLYVITCYFGIYKILEKEYPTVYKHLLQYEKELKARGQCRYTSSGKQKIGTDYPGQHHWLELDNNPSLEKLEDFGKPKIVWNRIASEKQFGLVEEGIYIQDSMHFIIGKNLEYLSAFLNSSPIQWLLALIIGEAAGGNAGNADNIWNLSIPKKAFTNEKIKSLIDKSEFGKLDNLICEFYKFTDEEIKAIYSKK